MSKLFHIPPDSWWHQREKLEAFAKTFDRDAKLSLKKSFVWKIGALKTFATTVGATVYIPADWTSEQARWVIPHECLGHMKQFRWCGLGIHPNLGIFPGMFLLYIFPAGLPIGLAWLRYRLEMHADSKSWEYMLKEGWRTPAEVRERAVDFAKTVASWNYVKAWPEKWAIWGFKRRAEKVIREVVS